MVRRVYGMVVVSLGVGGSELEYVGKERKGNVVGREDERGMWLVEK